MASSLSEAQVELTRTLSSDDIPIKLRCAICSKLAINAFRLPCCEQAICETCQVSLPQSCPVCEHSPLAAVDCNPNKSLRTTIRVFLRTAEKKREANRPKEAKSLAPANTDEATQQSQPSSDPSNGEQSIFQLASGTAICHESQESKPHDVAVRDPTPGISKTATAGSEGGTQKNDAGALYSLQASQALENDQSEYIDEAAAKGGDEDIHHAKQTVVEGADNLGEEENDQTGYRMENGYNHMIYPTSYDFNQMQMMMAMQNGMGNQAFNGFPMIGMNMNMDPMTMQNMYMNGGFQGMGMNGMNGIGGYGGGFGQGSNHNWNGSQSWSFDQDNYNQSGLGMTAGDFGNLSAGFQTGYNQFNYGQFADYRRNNFGRGRTRGRGFYGAYGRGGYQQNGAIGHHQDQSYHSQYGQAIQPSAPVESETRQDTGDTQQTVEDGHTGQLGNEERQDTENKAGDGVSEEAVRRGSGQLASHENIGNDASGDVARKGIQAGEAGAIRSVLSMPDVPINAPTGPKAMRQGLPNTSLHHLRARGYQVDAAPASPATASGAQQQQIPGGDKAACGRSRSPEREREKPTVAADDGPVRDGAQPTSHDVHGAGGYDRPARSRDGSPPASRRGARNGGDSTNRSRSRGHRGSHRARRRPRSLSPAEAENVGQNKAAEAGHRRKKSRSRRKGGGGGDRQVSRDDRRSRSASRDGTRKSGPRGSRESRDHDGRREHRDRQRDEERDRPSRRSRRERERERHRERERARGRERERERERDHEQARRRDRDSKRDGNRADTGSSHRASLGTGRSASMERGLGPGPGSGAGGVPSRNSHTLERDARNRERLLKEAQRMAGLAGSKRERDADAAADAASAGRSKGRRVGQRDGHHHHHAASDEERMRRLEAERDAGRWD